MSSLDSSFIGSGQFLFVEGAATVAAFNAGPVVDLGNVISLRLSVNQEEVRRWRVEQGTRRPDRSVITQSELSFDLRLDDIGLEQLKLFLGASAGTLTKSGYDALVPNRALNKAGMATLKFYDAEDTAENPSMIYEHFRCEIRGADSIDINPRGFAEMSLRVLSLDTAANLFIRRVS